LLSATDVTPGFRIERVAAPLRQSVTESIRYAIAVGRFKAGERLPERKLCEMTGVSRTLVREALRQLESERVIDVVPNRGPVVARLTIEQAEGIYQVRTELEGLAFQLFAERATTDQREALAAAFKKLKKTFKGADPMARLLAKNHFYECLVQGTGNEALGDSLRMLNARVMLLRATSMRLPSRVAASLLELAELMDVLGTQDGKKARSLAERHVRNAAHAALALLSSQHLLASLNEG
jgi:DNA-binding GntR family transcriptional regulator